MAPKRENEKVVAARERKEAAEDAKKAAAAAKAEEEKWKITDKKELKALDKKKADEDKHKAELARRAEKRELEKAEEASIPVSNKVNKAPVSKKLTQFEIAVKLAKAKKDLDEQAAKEKAFAEQIHEVRDDDLPVNLNHIARDEAMRAAEEGQEYMDASGIDAALAGLSISEADAHPEKRMRALHMAYEEKMMEAMKGDGLKRSQLKEKIFKMWQKAPENPMNQK